MPTSPKGSNATGAVLSQLALQRELFDALIRKISRNALLLLTLQKTAAEDNASPDAGKVVFLCKERCRSQINELVDDSRALGAAALELESDFQATANTHIAETRARVVHLVEVASRHSAYCSPELIRQIKLTIDNANAEIEHMRAMTEQIAQAAAALLDPVQQVLAVIGDA